MGKEKQQGTQRGPQPAIERKDGTPLHGGRGNAFAQEQMMDGVNAASGYGATLDAYADKGNSLLQDAMVSAGQIVGMEEEAEPVGPLELHAYVDVADFSYEALAVDGTVGHTWLEYTPHSGGPTESWGFWPAGPYSADMMDSYVAGEVRHDDPHAGDGGAIRKADITAGQLDAMNTYIASKTGAQYSVYLYNCTDFGTEGFAAAGQVSPASGVLGIDYPNALYEGIQSRNGLDGLDAAGEAP